VGHGQAEGNGEQWQADNSLNTVEWHERLLAFYCSYELQRRSAALIHADDSVKKHDGATLADGKAYDFESLSALSGRVGFAEWKEVMHGSAENRLD
jgi:hypothetical protein